MHSFPIELLPPMAAANSKAVDPPVLEILGDQPVTELEAGTPPQVRAELDSRTERGLLRSSKATRMTRAKRSLTQGQCGCWSARCMLTSDWTPARELVSWEANMAAWKYLHRHDI